MTWNVITVLGDALWRAEAGIALPGAAMPLAVDDLEAGASPRPPRQQTSSGQIDGKPT